jgi:putative transposase
MLIPMPRRPREEAAGALHHVVARGNNGESIVRDDRDRRNFIGRLDQAVARYEWICLAYCLLDTHFHLVLQTPKPNLGVGMRWLQSAYAQDLNYRHHRTGHVFGGRFYSVRLRSERHLISAVVYVSLNPVRAAVVDLPDDWPWCSYAATVGSVASPRFLNRAALLERFDRNPDTAQRRLATAVTETLQRDGRA